MYKNSFPTQQKFATNLVMLYRGKNRSLPPELCATHKITVWSKYGVS